MQRRFYTKLVKTALTCLRQRQNITISGYLDDQIQVCYDSMKEALLQGANSAEFFQNLGFTINVNKSVLIPTTRLEHLGFILDTVDMTVTMTEDKIGNILDMIDTCLKHDCHTIRQIAKLIGKIQATKPANPFALLYTKNMECDKNLALTKNRHDFEAVMKVAFTRSF